MRYRATVLTPTLVGSGQKLAPIDYMVWKDHVNVLDQERIFGVLARGPRLDVYLEQLRKAERLDFAAWGGFAQNFAVRRIPFESAAISRHWERAHPDDLSIPTFASTLRGPYLPATALRGALRTALLGGLIDKNVLTQLAERAGGERPFRRLGRVAEEAAFGENAADPMRLVSLGDSKPVGVQQLRVNLVRVANLVQRGSRVQLGWKQAFRGSVDPVRVADSTPYFVEMATPGTVFEGDWHVNQFLAQPEIGRVVHRRKQFTPERLITAANDYAQRALQSHRVFAERTGLPAIAKLVTALEQRSNDLNEVGGCLLNIGWGGGLLGKSALLEDTAQEHRELAEQLPGWNAALPANVPVPKTRRVVFLNDQPASLPGWVQLQLVD